MEREKRKDREPRSAAQKTVEYQYETGYTTEDTGNELDHTDYLYRWATTLLPVFQVKYLDSLLFTIIIYYLKNNNTCWAKDK